MKYYDKNGTELEIGSKVYWNSKPTWGEQGEESGEVVRLMKAYHSFDEKPYQITVYHGSRTVFRSKDGTFNGLEQRVSDNPTDGAT